MLAAIGSPRHGVDNILSNFALFMLRQNPRVLASCNYVQLEFVFVCVSCYWLKYLCCCKRCRFFFSLLVTRRAFATVADRCLCCAAVGNTMSAGCMYCRGAAQACLMFGYICSFLLAQKAACRYINK